MLFDTNTNRKKGFRQNFNFLCDNLSHSQITRVQFAILASQVPHSWAVYALCLPSDMMQKAAAITAANLTLHSILCDSLSIIPLSTYVYEIADTFVENSRLCD